MDRCSEPLNHKKGEPMRKEPKRLTISVSTDLFEHLRTLQKEEYPEKSRNEMLVDLIRKGLTAAESGVSPTKIKEVKE